MKGGKGCSFYCVTTLHCQILRTFVYCMSKKTIIGIDPGTVIMGYGVLSYEGKKVQVEALGVIQLRKYQSHYTRLLHIHEGVSALIRRHSPHELAIEAPFYGKNIQTTLKLGRAQGVAMAAALAHNIPITEYAPTEIKRAITGNGGASKEQVASLLQRMLHIPQESMLPELDATDGLAAAYCHFLQLTSPLPQRASSSWADFIRNNPDKVKGL